MVNTCYWSNQVDDHHWKLPDRAFFWGEDRASKAWDAGDRGIDKQIFGQVLFSSFCTGWGPPVISGFINHYNPY